MKANGLALSGIRAAATLAFLSYAVCAADPTPLGGSHVKHVLLLSVDGMHAVDLYNCVNGLEGVNGGAVYCPNRAEVSAHAIDYMNASSSKPSDSFPGLAALVFGRSPKSTGLYYDVAFDRTLDAPAATTGTGLAGVPCVQYGGAHGDDHRLW
jgi:Type I phosphodiesterase / nucleotide pyrophosphatase